MPLTDGAHRVLSRAFAHIMKLVCDGEYIQREHGRMDWTCHLTCAEEPCHKPIQYLYKLSIQLTGIKFFLCTSALLRHPARHTKCITAV